MNVTNHGIIKVGDILKTKAENIIPDVTVLKATGNKCIITGDYFYTYTVEYVSLADNKKYTTFFMDYDLKRYFVL